MFGHVKPRKTRGRFLEFCRYLRSLYPPQVRIAIICDNSCGASGSRPDGAQGRRNATVPSCLSRPGRESVGR